MNEKSDERQNASGFSENPEAVADYMRVCSEIKRNNPDVWETFVADFHANSVENRIHGSAGVLYTLIQKYRDRSLQERGIIKYIFGYNTFLLNKARDESDERMKNK